MNNLDMIKAFAKLEGVATQQHDDGRMFYNELNERGYAVEYNPITDLSLAMKAMIDYEVNVDNYSGCVFTDNAYTDEDRENVVSFCVDNDMPRAIIECILKSKGLWNDN